VENVCKEISGVRFRRVNWTREIERKLTRACRGDERVIASQVLDGQAVLWEINGGESHLVTRVDFPELVIVCYEGSKVRQVLGVVFIEAKRQGYRNIRFHTQWAKLIDIFRDYGPEPLEYVVRIPCNGR